MAQDTERVSFFMATPRQYLTGMDCLVAAFNETTNAFNVSGGGSSSTDGSTFTAGSTTGSIFQGVYQASPSALTDGKAGAIRVSSNRAVKIDADTLAAGEDLTNNVLGVAHKPVASSTYSGTSFVAVLNDVDISVKASAGNLLSISCSNINAAIRYLQLHNKASAPSAGETATFSFPIPAGSGTAPSTVTIDRDFLGPNGHYFSTGIAVGVSTAAATFTAATTTDHVVNGTYV